MLDSPYYFNIENYNLYYNESKINKADGRVKYVKSELKSNTIIETFGKAKFLSTIITGINNKKIKISSIYRCFGHDKLEFIYDLKKLLESNK